MPATATRIETDYVYSQHDGGWYAEQCRIIWDDSRQRASFRVSKAVYSTREECQREVTSGRALFGIWS